MGTALSLQDMTQLHRSPLLSSLWLELAMWPSCKGGWKEQLYLVVTGSINLLFPRRTHELNMRAASRLCHCVGNLRSGE